MKITKSKLLKIIKEELSTINEIFPTTKSKPRQGRSRGRFDWPDEDQYRTDATKGTPSVARRPSADREEDPIDYEKGKVGGAVVEAVPADTPKGLSTRDKLDRGPAKHRGSLGLGVKDNFYYVNRDGEVSPGFPTMGRDPREFAEVVLTHLEDTGKPLTVNIYEGDPFEHGGHLEATVQIIGGEIIEPDTGDWPDDPEDILTSPDEERYLSGEDRYDESRRRINKKKLQKFIAKEVMKALNEDMVANIEKTDISGAEKLMDPRYRAHSYTAPSLQPFVSDDETFIVTLTDGTKITASVGASGSISLYDTEDREIDNEALEQEVLNMIAANEVPEDILTSPDEERYLSGEDRYNEVRRR